MKPEIVERRRMEKNRKRLSDIERLQAEHNIWHCEADDCIQCNLYYRLVREMHEEMMGGYNDNAHVPEL